MEFAYKCPVCRAQTILKEKNQYCKRCKGNLQVIYRLKKKKIYKSIAAVMKKHA